ncbi:glycosyltransferase family 4 protein [Halalkalicoccus ordinarius]|uniref:glycosyltransferase family 4 protein n=1 Tax=Halalkalicoccus ordinarius TaxID=3116651 RepID=UPI00300EF978
MKILRLSQEIYPDVTGGGAYHAHALSRDQADMGHDVTVVTFSSEIEDTVKSTRDGYTLIKSPTVFSVFGNEISIDSINHVSNQKEYDVVHTHAHFYFLSNLAAVYRHFRNTPLAITNHSLISQSVSPLIAKFHLYTVGKFTFSSSDMVFCYTKEEEQRLRSLGLKNEIKIIANGIDTAKFNPDGDRSGLIKRDEDISLLFVGRLNEGKRPTDAVRALRNIRNRSNLNCTLYICGDGPLRDQLLQTVADYGLEDSVTYLGIRDYDEMPSILRSADLLILPSRSEGVPRTVLESLASETPVIASDLDQISELVEAGGTTVATGDIDGYTNAILSLANNDTLRDELGKKGREVIRDQGYTWESTVRATTAALQSLAEPSINDRR